MDCLTRIGGSIVGYLAAPIGYHLGYLFYYDTNMNNLEDQIQTLDATIKRLDKQVEEAQRNGKQKNEDFQKWLSEAGMRLNEAKIILDDEGRNEAKCTCTGPFPNLLTRYKLSRRACEMAETIVSELRKELKEKFRSPILRSSFKNRNFQAFNATKKAMDEIMEALNDANLSKIGVYGMGGIGKTTIVKEVARQVQEEGSFSEVIMVTVSQSFELKNIQKEVAGKLGLKELKESESEIAEQLKHRLKDEKKILLIFDDIWKKVDLEEAGISFREDQSGCKMIFVSRDRDVLCQHMDVQKEIAVGFLSRKEAMDLFIKFVGDLNKKPADFKQLQNVADAIVAECGDLPISIVTIASALKNKDIANWRNALRQLSESPDQEINKPVYLSIKMSYDDVVEREGRLLKSVLLLCALHGEDEDISVEELVSYAVGWDLFGYVETWEAARDSMHSAVGRLKARCLLLDGDDCGTVKMHDVIRDVARSIAAKDENMHSFTEVAEFEWYLTKGKPEDSIAITLHDLDFSRLLERLKCFRLELFLIFNVSWSIFNKPKPIGNECFEEMKGLKVLRCEKTICPEPLLASICSLQNLQMLSLPDCKLEDIALIGELKNLIILDLSSSTVEQLPQQIGKLTKLQQLNLKYCDRLEVIQPDVISNLVQLEELYMDEVHVQWKTEGVDDGEGSYNASLIELTNLKRLKALHLYIADRRALPKDKDFIENLERYSIIIGIKDIDDVNVREDSSRVLHLEALDERSGLLYQPGFQTLMKKCKDLYLGTDLLGVNNIAYQLDVNGFRQLKNLEVEGNDEVQNIVESTGEIQPCSAFENLETLRLSLLSNLENICCGRFRTEPFGQLRRIEIDQCQQLKRVFSVSNIISGKLEEIKVRCCKMMEEIVYDGSEDGAHNIGAVQDEATNIDTSIEFRNIRSLTLKVLPKLVHFFRSEFYSSPNSPIPLFNEKVAFPVLEKLELSALHSVQTLWPNRLPEIWSMQKIKKLSVSGFESLKYLFSVAMARSFVQLKQLEVMNCKSMEEVLVIKEPGQERRPKDTILFSQVEALVLTDLPNLRRFYVGDFAIECLSLLRDLKIKECPKLKTLINTCREENEETEEPFFSGKVAFPVLEKLELSDLHSVQTLWPNRLPEVWSMQKIKKFRVSDCESLKYLFSVAMARSFVQLKQLEVMDCKNMEEVLVIKEPGQDGRPEEITLFPQLETLTLSFLPNFKRFYGTEEPFFSEKVAFPRLEKLTVIASGSFKYLLSYGMARSLLQLQSLTIKDCRHMEVVVVIKEPFKDGRLENISFSKLEYVQLDSLPGLKRFSSVDCIEFSSLKELSINGCHELGTYTASSTTAVPIIKDEREVEKRKLVRTQQPLFTEKVLFSNSSKHFQLFRTSFKSLVSLEIKDCNNLVCLLPLDTVESLAQLKKLHISGCKAMKEVIVVTKKHRKEGSFEKISLPKLESLELEDLPRLRRFCVADCIKCPLLLKLEITNCLELRTFVANLTFTPTQTTVEEEIGKRDLVGQQPMLNEKVVFPNLEELILFHTGTEILNEIWPSLSSAVPFPKLKNLCLFCPKDRNWDVFLFDIHKYQYLEEISLGGFSSMENLRQRPEPSAVEEYSGRTLTRLRGLCLDSFPMRLFEDPEDFRTFQNLEILWIKSCGRLTTLVMSSSVYFQNLRKLRISKCEGMINLLASSAAKCLVQLKTMSISECVQMTEIIAEKEDEAESEIAFTKLKTLGLHRLPTLKSFYCGNSKIRFPKLKKVIVSECPQMENFSLGTVITSKLKGVISKIEPLEDDYDELEDAEDIEEVWEGDLNASVRMIWENDLYTAVQNLFSETDDESSEEQIAVHQDVEKLKEDIASSSSSK